MIFFFFFLNQRSLSDTCIQDCWIFCWICYWKKWFWFLSLFLTCSKAFLSSASKVCFYNKLKCTFSVSTWYLWTSTILKAVLCFQKYIQSCLFYAVTAVVDLWVFFLYCTKFSSLSSCLEKIQQRTQKVISWRLYPTSLWRASACRLSLLKKVDGRRKEKNHLSTPALAARLLSFLSPCAAPLCRWLVRRGWAGDARLERADELLPATWQSWTPRPGCAGSVVRLIVCCSWLPLWVWWFACQTVVL